MKVYRLDEVFYKYEILNLKIQNLTLKINQGYTELVPDRDSLYDRLENYRQIILSALIDYQKQ